MRLSQATARPWVVKIGGRLCEDAGLRAALAMACAGLDAPLVVVHGGGAQITGLQERFGGAPRFHEGRRVTGEEDLMLVEMALSGRINKELVRALQAAGCEAVGISGCDGGLIECSLVPHLGRVGLPERVRPAVLDALLSAGWTPVVSPVSMGPDGAAVNVNADEAACALAAALGAERLLLLSDVEGVRVDGAAVRTLDVRDVEGLVHSGQITGGMVPKIRSAAVAVAAGVGRVVIAGFAGGALDLARGTEVISGAAGDAAGAAARPSPVNWAALTRRIEGRTACAG